MLIRPNNHKSIVIVLSVLLLSITAFLLLYLASRSWAYRYYCFKETAVEYAKNGHSVTMGTLFTFDWDEVYSDSATDARLMFEISSLTSLAICCFWHSYENIAP